MSVFLPPEPTMPAPVPSSPMPAPVDLAALPVKGKAKPVASSGDLQATQEKLLTGPGLVQPQASLPDPSQTNLQASDTRLAREDKTTGGDYLRSMWRQDGLAEGIVASVAGHELAPDENYSPFANEKDWKELSNGIWPEFQPELYHAHSAAHALYIKGRLEDKQADLEKLGDLGWKGNAGRIAFNVVSPDQLLAGMAGGWATRGLSLVEGAAGRAALRAATSDAAVLRAAEGVAATRAAQAARATSKAAIAGGVASGGLTNAGIEYVRQSVNFEDDNTALLESGLMGAALSAPFIAGGIRRQRRIAAAAASERDALGAVRAMHAGEEPTPVQAAALEKHKADAEMLGKFNQGTSELSADEISNKIHGEGEAASPIPSEAPAEATPVRQPGPPEATPDGFLHGSIGSAQIEKVGSIADNLSRLSERTVRIGDKEIKVPLRLDIFSVFNKSTNPEIRKLGFDMVKDPLQIDSHYAQGWTASEWKAQLRRTVAGEFHSDSKQAFNGAAREMGVGAFGRHAFAKDFYEKVSRLTRGDDSILKDNQPIAKHLQAASNAQKKGYARLLKEAKDAGVKGAEDIQPNDFYVNRKWSHEAIRDAINTHGEDAVVRVLADSIKNPAIAGDKAKAKSFLNVVRKLEFSPVMQDIHLYGKDMLSLRNELRAHGVSEGDMNTIIDTMFERQAQKGDADAGNATNLKYRFDLDENYKADMGAGKQLGVSDLLENDARVLMDTYTNSLAGHVAMAKKGIHSRAEWNERMQAARDHAASDTSINSAQAQRELALMDDMYNHVTGRPMSTQDFSTANRVANTFRGYVRSTMLGQLGISAAFEMKQAIALSSFKAMLQHMPTLGNLMESMKNGYIPDRQLARDISSMAGFGHEMASSYARHQEIEDGFMGQVLSRAEKYSNNASHAVDILSGNASFTSISRQWAGMMFVQHHVDLATGKRKLTASKRERLVGQGLDDDMQDSVLSQLKSYSDLGPDGRVEHIRWEDWKADHPEGYESYQLALSREVRDAIQDHDFGETMPFMHSTLGKLFSELKTFFLVAHAKNFLKNVSYMDQTAFQVWGLGFLGESLGYMTQSTANYAQDPEKLQQMLTPEKIAMAGFSRMSSMGMVPSLIDTGYSLATGGDSLIQPGTTTNTDNRSLFNTPSIIAAKKLLNAPSNLGGLAFGTDITTQKEMRDLLTTLPGSNLYGARNFVNYLSNMQPKFDPNHPGQQ